MAPKKRKPSSELASGSSRPSSRSRNADTTDINDVRIDVIEKQNEFKLLFDELKKKFNQAELDLTNGDYFKDHCNEIRRQVQLEKETKIQAIERMCEELFNEIDNFEKNSLKKKTNDNKEKLTAELKTLRQDKEKWNKNIDEYQINDQLIFQARESLTKLKFKRDKINKLLFDELLLFKSNTDKIAMGSLSKIVIDSSKLNQKLELKQHINELENSYHVKFNYLNDVNEYDWNDRDEQEEIINVSFECSLCHSFSEGSILLCGKIEDDWNSVYDYVLMVFDVETNSLKAVKKLFVDLSSLQPASNKLCLVYQQTDFPEEYESDEHDQEEYETEYDTIEDKDFFYLVLNKDLEKLNGMKKKGDLNFNGASDSYLFSVSQHKGEINIYDWSFKHLRRIGQSNDLSSSYYFPFDTENALRLIHAKNSFYFLAKTNQNDKHIRVINEKTGQLLQKHDFIGDFFLVDKFSSLIQKNSNQNKLCYLSSSGELLKTIEMGKQSEFEWFLDETKQTLCCFDKKSYTLWFQRTLDEQNYQVI